MKSRYSAHYTPKIPCAYHWQPDEIIIPKNHQTILSLNSHAWKYETEAKYVGQEYAFAINGNVEELIV